MDLRLNGKVALVGASSTGLGKAVALALAEEGTDVIICSRDSDKLRLVSEEIQKKGTKCLAIPTDLTKYSQVQNLVTRSIEYFGKIDILVTNCGGPPSGEFLDFSVDDWKQAINLNLMSTIYLCKEILPYMVKQNDGRVIMITSVSVKQPIKGLILSNVTRAGVAGLAKSLSNEYGKNNILVNIVCPGYTRTERVEQLAVSLSAKQGLKPVEMIQNWAQLNSLGRLATPEEFANVVVFLASEKASHLTGTAIQIDGGLVKSLL
ncbi:MAG: SDR family oxidoreductase [Candidatus Heimdallarchaeota archaeon]|nr:MAG: SDR family oxidoreductase [Candidatus Heimdallarchaeota archaeon]